MTHDVVVNMVYENRAKQAVNDDMNNNGTDGSTDNDTTNNDTTDKSNFDEDEKAEIISVVFTEMCNRLKV